ncbi:MAG: hypothetical protein H6810_08070 [Phycisphaeraceae bacterium]|nr:MAG: hypothetical protein H6810_08070 [Phycisphaeraceae bacterium]
MRRVFDRPNRLDRRFEEFLALCASCSPFAKGYTPAQHASALDALLADMGIADPGLEKPVLSTDIAGFTNEPEIVVKPIFEEDDSHLFLAATC